MEKETVDFAKFLVFTGAIAVLSVAFIAFLGAL